MDAGNGPEVPGETALRPRRNATRQGVSWAPAALAGLILGLVFGWWGGRQRPTLPVAPPPIAGPPIAAPAQTLPQPRAFARAPEAALARPAKRRYSRIRVTSSRLPQGEPVTTTDRPWWLDLVGDNPYR